MLSDIGWAREHGYGTRLAERAAELQRNDPDHAYANAFPKADRVRHARTLDGDPSDGMLMSELPAGGAIQTPRHSCQAEANEQLYGDFPAWFRAEKAATGLTALTERLVR